MATAGDIIERSMRLLHQLGSGQSPTAAEFADGLEALNALIESWRNERLMCYAFQEETLTLSNNDGSYTIGPSGDLNTTRPVAIERAWIVDAGISYPVRIIEESEYVSIPDKTTQSDWPDVLLYRPTMSTGTILIYPLPNGTRTLKLLTRVPVTSFASTATSVTLPPGWERALAYNLAVEWAPEFETQAAPAVERIARESKASIKSVNHRPLKTRTGLSALVGATRISNIETDQP